MLCHLFVWLPVAQGLQAAAYTLAITTDEREQAHSNSPRGT